jgi:hypothetical protein
MSRSIRVALGSRKPSVVTSSTRQSGRSDCADGAGGLDPQREQPGERHVDVVDLVDGDRLAETAQPGELVVGQRRVVGRAEIPPALAFDRDERRRRPQFQQQRAWGRASRASWRRRSKSRRDITGSPGCSRRRCST